MQKTILLFLFCLTIAFPALSQTAKFIADTSDLRMRSGENQVNFDRAMEMQWIINGKKLSFGKTIDVQPSGKEMDIVLFKQGKNSKWNTMYCFIRPGKTYTFVYNECCGGFDVRDPVTKCLYTGKLSMTIVGKSPQFYFGKMGESALVDSAGRTDSLTTTCNSALTPKIYPVCLYSITECKASTRCIEAEECVFKNGKKDIDDTPFYYRIDSTIISFMYLPLQNEMLNIIYDPKTKKIIRTALSL